MRVDTLRTNTNRLCNWANGINPNAINSIDVECCGHRFLSPNSSTKYLCNGSGPCHLADSVNAFLASLSRLRRLP